MNGSLRHAGVTWPNGPSDDAALYGLPSPLLLMCSPEARWRTDAARALGKEVWWRAIPRPGKRPAELGWAPHKISAECLNLWDEQSGASDFIDLNELDLQDERGDHDDDWGGLDARYALIGGVLLRTTSAYRASIPGVRLHFPAFTPDHHALDHVGVWRAAAESRDCVDIHAYGTTEDIRAHYMAYRAAFPSMPIAITEWHSAEVGDDRETLEYLAGLAERDPLFWGAVYFSWRWDGGWATYMNVEGNAAREALFRDPPTVAPAPIPIPAPEPIPMPAYSRDQMIAISNAAADAAGIPRHLLLACGLAESGLRADARRPVPAALDTEYWPDVSGGAWQTAVRWDPDYQGGDGYPGPAETERVLALQYDPNRSARVAAENLKGKLRVVLEQEL